jgi:hypothetical protein
MFFYQKCKILIVEEPWWIPIIPGSPLDVYANNNFHMALFVKNVLIWGILWWIDFGILQIIIYNRTPYNKNAKSFFLINNLFSIVSKLTVLEGIDNLLRIHYSILMFWFVFYFSFKTAIDSRVKFLLNNHVKGQIIDHFQGVDRFFTKIARFQRL